MKNVLRLILPLVVAAVLGGATGYVVVDEFVMQRPRQSAAWKAGRSGNGVVAAQPKHVDKGVREVRKIAEKGLPRKHQWIAEVKVGPYRSFWRDREYPVVRELMLSDERKLDAFDENVIGRINDSDPLFWSVTTGDVAEEIPELGVTYMRDGRGAHMRLIIGYNEERGEVLWGFSRKKRRKGPVSVGL